MICQRKAMSIKSRPTALIILDGFGYRTEKKFNAIAQAHTPTFDFLLNSFAHTHLKAAGPAVGLLEGQMGNSEVGHLTIGAGRIVPQDIIRINTAIEDGSFFTNQILTDHLSHLASTGKALHIMGLLSDGGVHSHIDHLAACLKAAQQQGVSPVFVHAFLDGRDVPPQSAEVYLKRLDQLLSQYNAQLASIQGRFYAMDRDDNWDRTKQSYKLLTQPNSAPRYQAWQEALAHYYKNNLTDEFIPPTHIAGPHVVQEGDGILFYNFRPDRARQLTRCFVSKTITPFVTKKIPISFFITPTSYNHGDHQTTILFEPHIITETFKEILSKHNKSLFTIAETEKYAHVTYFFDGGREEVFPGETRILIPSIPAQDYSQFPAMSAEGITNAIKHSLEQNSHDFYLANYANADMVGHSGNFEATVKAIECLDAQLAVLYDTFVKKHNGSLYITSDHGNAEEMFDERSGQPKTSHTNNPVYFIAATNDHEKLPSSLNGLSDIAPFLLKNMEIPVPKKMK